jgi:hypothetical protein
MKRPKAGSAEERTLAYGIAAKTGCDFRTAIRALREGPDVIRTLAVREAVKRAMETLR